MKSIFTLGITFLLLCNVTFAQRFDTETNSGWFFGLNGGAAWNSTDIQNKTKFGGGFILGKTLNTDYSSPLSFDLRLRYLRAFWEGQDYDTTGSIIDKPAYSGYHNDTVGFAVQNFQNDVHHLGLELAIHANRFRYRTGIDPYIFGGLNIVWNQGYGDLVNGSPLDSTTYDYATIPLGGSVDNALDGTFETPLDGSNASEYNVNFMPSLGVGLGYYVTPRFSIGIEHKTTFTLKDDFDGTIFNQDGAQNDRNDWYHYTNGYLRWYFRGGNSRDDRVVNDPIPDPVDPIDPTPEVTDPNQPLLPIVDFTNPSSSPHTVSVPNFNLKGRVQFVNGASNVLFKQNGVVNSNFLYNPSTDLFTSAVTLNPGQNVFYLQGTNEDGSDNETVIIVYERPDAQPTPPVVNITNPNDNPHTVNTPNYTLSANILNVASANDITMTVNGTSYTNFSFNANTDVLTSNLVLSQGTTTVTITGTNVAGSDSDNTTFIYRPANNTPPPVVNFTNPQNSPYTHSSNSFNIAAEVLNVDNAQHITFKQNGSVNANFTYNAITDVFGSNVILNPGQNVFEIIATNNVGTDQASTIIIYDRPDPKPPVVTITNPSVNPYTTQNASIFVASTILNVTSASQVTFNLNGTNVTNFSFNPSTGQLTTMVNLVAGANVITVTGTNNDGTDSKNTTIIYSRPITVQPPVVDFVSPGVDPFTTTSTTHNVIATVQNVDNSSQINVNANGNNITSFSFNPTTKTVTFNQALIVGTNVITITGTNTAGADSESQTIIRRGVQTVQPPVVTFINPISNPQTSFNSSYNVSARVRYVSAAQNITLRINGAISTSFTYSTSSEIMNFTTGLIQGANVIEVTGTNNDGTDVASTTIIYRPQSITNPPTVDITNPGSSATTSLVQNVAIAATVQNVTSASNIGVTVNGTTVSNFIYNSANHQVNFTANLVSGGNSIVVTASNTAGTASDNTSIIYRPAATCNPPFVTFTRPATNGSTVTIPGYIMKANVQNVNAKSGVTVKFNGQTISSNLYTFNTATKEVVYLSNLNEGNNTFQVTGTNTAGNHSATATIIYNKPVVPCDGPLITFINPVTGGSAVSTNTFAFKAKVMAENASNITLLVNGAAQSNFGFNSATKFVTKTISLQEGNNSIEIIATNDCGRSQKSTTVIYRKVVINPCIIPALTAIVPASALTTQNATIDISASSIGVNNASEVTLTVNGQSKPFTYDAATHVITSTVALAEGQNVIILRAKNNCGNAEVKWMITREVCHTPVITYSTVPAISGVVNTPDFQILGTITNVDNSSVITVLHNGQGINYVYNSVTEELTVNRTLVVGVNNFQISIRSSCGNDVKKFAVTHKPVVIVNPPTVKIQNPSANPFNTTQGAITVLAKVMNVTNHNQIAVTVNNQAVNFNFNAATNDVTFNENLDVGNNMVNITAVNSAGTASDNTNIIYTAPVTLNPPVISFTKPTVSPFVVSEGRQTVSGVVQNITNINEVQILVNGNPFSAFTPTLINGTYNFTFFVSIATTHPTSNIQVLATTAGGSDAKGTVIQLQTNSSTVGTGSGSVTIGGGTTVIGGGTVGGSTGTGSGTGAGSGSGSGTGGGTRIQGTNTKPTKPTRTTKPTGTRGGL